MKMRHLSGLKRNKNTCDNRMMVFCFYLCDSLSSWNVSCEEKCGGSVFTLQSVFTLPR